VDKLLYNGKYFSTDTPLITAASRGLRYGDGCFETMKIIQGQVVLAAFHWERLFTSMEAMGFDIPKHFTAALLEQQVKELAAKNHHTACGRVRLTVFRGEGGLYDPVNHHPHYIIETYALDDVMNQFNENGLVLDIYADARKTADLFSHIKSNSFLPYTMAAGWVKKHQLNDAVLLNAYDRIADTTIANVFIVTDGIIKTPGLQEGCVGGVMRQYIIRSCKQHGIPITEAALTTDELLAADEVFLTNAIRGIRWVKQVASSAYQCSASKMLYHQLVKPLWQ